MAAIAGCSTPFTSAPAGSHFREDIAAAIDREIAFLSDEDPTYTTTQPPAEVEQTLADRREELEALGPATEAARTPFSLGPDLAGNKQQTVSIRLETAITNAVENNLPIRSAAMAPAINRQDVINAEAVFDVLLFANANLDKIDQPAPTPVLNGLRLGTPFNASEQYRFETGVRKRFMTGGQVAASTDLTRFRNNAPGFELSPDPAYTGALRLGVEQPLLRGFGADVNTATIRLAANTERRAVAALTSDVLDLVEEVESAYWDLVFAWLTVEIRQWLVDVGTEVRDNLDARRAFDVKDAEYADAVATVAQRKADVIRARRRVRAVSDRLKLLMNDPHLTVGGEALLEPVDSFIDAPIDYRPREMLLTALGKRPEIELALLAIDDASIGQVVADNARLPLLNLSGEIAYFGQDDAPGDAYSDTFDDRFVDYVLALVFEYPLGNRGPEAQYRRARLRRSQAVLGYRRAVQEVVLDVKAALRDVVTNYELIQATRSFRIAQAENLRTLQAEEPIRGLTPEFLNLKFQRQEGLARARAEELQALVNFDQSLAALHRAMGVGLEMNRIDIEVVGEDDVADALRDAPDR